MSDAHFAPKKLARVLALRERLYGLVAEGTLSREEANLTIAAAMKLGTPPKRVRCAKCKTAHRLVGIADAFTCGCSPDERQSVWDNAIG